MRMVAVGSVKGSPGATTISAVLAATWPDGPALVVEADPAGGDLTSWMKAPSEPGMVTLAAAARHGGGPGVADRHLQILPGGLPALVMPPGAEGARNVVRLIPPDVIGGIKAAHNAVVDVGRLDPGTLAATWLQAADVLLLVLRGRAADVMHLRARASALDGSAPTIGLVVVGGDESVALDAAEESGFPLVGRVLWDERAAGALRGERPVRNWPGSDLVRSTAVVARRTHALAADSSGVMEAAG